VEPATPEPGALTVEEIASAALVVARERDLAAMTSRLLAIVQSWATISLVACVEKDPRTDAGWRLHPGLTSGQLPRGFERSVAKLAEDGVAGGFTRPTVIRPVEDLPAAGVKVRDSWVVPWHRGDSSGFLLLRGVARPYPPNLGDAVALVSLPLWPLVAERQAAEYAAGEGPVAERTRRLDEIAEAARRLAEQIRAEVKDEEATPAAPVPPEPGESAEALEAARRELAELKERLASTEAERTILRNDRDAARTDQAELLRRLEAAERELAQSRTALAAGERDLREARGAAGDERKAVAGLREALAEAKASLERSQALQSAAETALAQRIAERDEARHKLAALQGRADDLERTLARANEERDQAKATANHLWASVESLQKEVQAGKQGVEAHQASLDEQRRAQEALREEAAGLKAELAARQAEAERADAGSRADQESAGERIREAEEKAQAAGERWERAVATFREAVDALRRTPFVPPTLRVSFGAVEEMLRPEGAERQKPGAATGRVLFLDRDVPGLDGLARALEAEGLEVLAAHYPEEVAFFLKTSGARGITAVVCDVMAFRPDQDLRDVLRGWRQDAPGLPVLLSFRSDTPLEGEKAQRVPSLLTAGYVPRPLEQRALLDALAALHKRQAGAGPGGPHPPDRAV
jgi:hypothetical protein